MFWCPFQCGARMFNDVAVVVSVNFPSTPYKHRGEFHRTHTHPSTHTRAHTTMQKHSRTSVSKKNKVQIKKSTYSEIGFSASSIWFIASLYRYSSGTRLRCDLVSCATHCNFKTSSPTIQQWIISTQPIPKMVEIHKDASS